MGVARRLYGIVQEYGVAFVPVIGARHYMNKTKKNLELLVGLPPEAEAEKLATATKIIAVASTAGQLISLGELVMSYTIGFAVLAPIAALTYVGGSIGIACGIYIVNNYYLPDIKQTAGQPS